MIHDLSRFRVSRALSNVVPGSVREVWKLLESIGFEPYVVLGKDDFDEMLKHGGNLVRDDYASFSPQLLLESELVSDHVKELVRELL